MTWLSVDLPEPFGPMMACTSPLFTVSESPWRISRSSTRTSRFLTSSSDIHSILNLIRQFEAFLDAIKAELDSGDVGVIVLLNGHDPCKGLPYRRHLDAQGQQRIARRKVARAGRLAMRGDKAAIGVLRHAGGDALGDDPAGGVLAEMNHLGAGIDLLVTVRNRDRIELAARIVAAQDAARIFPGDRRSRFDLGPGNLRIVAPAIAALGDEIVDSALAFGVAGIPILHRLIFDLGVIERDQFD